MEPPKQFTKSSRIIFVFITLIKVTFHTVIEMRDFWLQPSCIEKFKEELSHVAIVFEYMEKNLQAVIQEKDLSESRIRVLMRQFLTGLLFLKSRQILHRDL